MKKLLFILFFLPYTAFGAIAFDNSGVDGGSGSSPHTFSTDMAATSTTNIVIINVEVNSGSDTNSCSAGTVSVNGVQATPTTARKFVALNGTLWVYYAMNVGGKITVKTTACTGGQTNIAYQSYTGVNATNPIASNAASTTNTASGASGITTALTTVDDNSWVIGFVMNSAGSGIAVSTGVTSRGIYYSGYLGTGDSGSAITPAGSYSMSWTGPSSNWATIQLSLSPATSALSTVVGTIINMGNGVLNLANSIIY
jgi:hypothetical protein